MLEKDASSHSARWWVIGLLIASLLVSGGPLVAFQWIRNGLPDEPVLASDESKWGQDEYSVIDRRLAREELDQQNRQTAFYASLGALLFLAGGAVAAWTLFNGTDRFMCCALIGIWIAWAAWAWTTATSQPIYVSPPVWN